MESCRQGPQGSVIDDHPPDRHRNHDAEEDDDVNNALYLLFGKVGAFPIIIPFTEC